MTDTAGLVKYDAARRALAAARRTDDVIAIRDKAARLRLYAEQAKDHELEADAAEIRLRAERRLGELIAEQKRTVGLNQGAKGFKKTSGSKREPVADDRPTLADAGIDKKLSMRSQQLAALPEPQFEARLDAARERITQQADRVATTIAKPTTTARTGKKAQAWDSEAAIQRIRAVINREADQTDAEGCRVIGNYLRQIAHFLAPLRKEKSA